MGRSASVEKILCRRPIRSTRVPTTFDFDFTIIDYRSLAIGLCETWSMDERHVIQLLQAASQGAYSEAVAQMAFHRWALEAAACELIEIALQGALVPLADPKLASHCGINWTPDFTSWLFDTDRIPAPARQLLKELSSNIRFDQDWSSAQKWTDVVLRKRQDLAWCGDVAGWAAEKNGDAALAAQLYFANRHSSAFTDQSVRLRSHWFSEHFGKFSIAQLSRLQEHLSSSDRDDLYLQTLWTSPAQRTRAAVRDYWLREAQWAEERGNPTQAYAAYFQAGWDLGAERLSDYREILAGLQRTALQLGWQARAMIAATHAECLERRMPK